MLRHCTCGQRADEWGSLGVCSSGPRPLSKLRPYLPAGPSECPPASVPTQARHQQVQLQPGEYFVILNICVCSTTSSTYIIMTVYKFVCVCVCFTFRRVKVGVFYVIGWSVVFNGKLKDRDSWCYVLSVWAQFVCCFICALRHPPLPSLSFCLYSPILWLKRLVNGCLHQVLMYWSWLWWWCYHPHTGSTSENLSYHCYLQWLANSLHVTASGNFGPLIKRA